LDFPLCSFSRVQIQWTVYFRKEVSSLIPISSHARVKEVLYHPLIIRINGVIRNQQQLRLICLAIKPPCHLVVNKGLWDRSVVVSVTFRTDRNFLTFRIKIVSLISLILMHQKAPSLHFSLIKIKRVVAMRDLEDLQIVVLLFIPLKAEEMSWNKKVLNDINTLMYDWLK
jgi:hypothetical protein